MDSELKNGGRSTPTFNTGLANKLCRAQISLSKKIARYLKMNPTINEESITDILVTEWRILDRRFNFCNVYKHSRRNEARTGVDIELELWIINNGLVVTLAFQAKKLIKDFNKYRSMFCYPNNTKDQLKNLIKYSEGKNQIPVYLLYGQLPKKSPIIRKNMSDLPCSLFIKDAYSINSEFTKNGSYKLSKNAILEKSRPFHDLFCLKKLPMNELAWDRLFKELFPDSNIESTKVKIIPNYVKELVNNKSINEIPPHLKRVKYLGVLNLDE